MPTDHICPEPGCGMEKSKREFMPHIGYQMVCPRNADAHALCARVAELESTLRAVREVCRQLKTLRSRVILDAIKIVIPEAPHEPPL